MSTARLEKLMGARALGLAKRAGIKLRCEAEHGSHRWMIVGAKKGKVLLQECRWCGTRQEVEL